MRIMDSPYEMLIDKIQDQSVSRPLHLPPRGSLDARNDKSTSIRLMQPVEHRMLYINHTRP